ncbi:MAG: lipopolysaccharide biosynthesis protein [Armatimonadota bacterium]|jgi:O-antigen/teichoic acid export membrane protein
MSQSRAVRVIRDSSYLMTGQLVMGAVGIVTSAWLARNLVPAELAIFPATMTLEAIAYAFTGLGMYDGFVREATPLISAGQERQASALIKTGLLLTIGASVIFCVGLYIGRDQINRFLLAGTASDVAMQLMAAVVLPRLVLRHVWGAMNAAQEYRWLAVTRATEHCIRAIGAVALYIAWGIVGSLIALAAGSVVGVILATVVIRSLLRGDGSWVGTRHALAVGWPYYAAALCSNLKTRVDYLVVGALGGAAPLATYFVAEKIYEYLGHLSRNLLDTTQTKIAEQAMEGSAALARSFVRCTRYFFLGLAPIYFASAAMSSVIVDLYAGGNYPDAGAVLAMLCAAGLLTWFTAIHRRFVLVIGRRWHPLALDATNLVSSAAFVSVCMMLLGPIGAALGTMLANIPLLILSFILLSQVLQPRYDLNALWIGLGSGSAILLLTQLTMWLVPSTLGALMAVGIMLPIYYLFIRGRLERNDLDMIFGLVPNRVRQTPRGARIEGFFRDDLVCRSASDVAAR